MKAFELISLWKSFDELMDSADLSDEDKLNIGRDMIVCMPPEAFCAQAANTHQIVLARMRERVSKLEANVKPAERNDTQASEPSSSTEADAAPKQRKPRKG